MHDALLPRPPGGLVPGAGLALLVHAGLVAALTLAVDWRMKAPEAVSAELWAAVPQVAAPKIEAPPTPAPAPTPAPPPPAPAPAPKAAPPPPAQIATERIEKRKPAPEPKEVAPKPDPEKKKREAEAQKADEARLAQLRDEQMKRMLGSLQTSGTPTSTGSASQDAAPSQAYIGRLIARIKQNVVFNDNVSGNPAAEVEVRAAPNGSIIARRLIKSSGSKEWDDAVLRAIDRTGSLPRDTDGRIPPTIIVAFRPKE